MLPILAARPVKGSGAGQQWIQQVAMETERQQEQEEQTQAPEAAKSAEIMQKKRSVVQEDKKENGN